MLGAALLVPAAASADPQLPEKRTPVSRIAPGGTSHHEVLRIKSNGLGPTSDHDIVLDAWTLDRDGSIAGVKMWWVDRSKANERSPFGKTVRARIDVQPRRIDATHWEVRVRSGGRGFTVHVRAQDGQVAAFGTVKSHGERIEGCRATSSKVIPTTVLGIPTGLDRLQVSCLDPKGIRQHGRLE